jgi:hypothetical protein
MTIQSSFDALVTAANAELTDLERNHLVGGAEGENTRFELYHAGLSICSQKVRAVLAEKGSSYLSHELVILNSRGIYSEGLTLAENYRPGYVRLRMFGVEKLGLEFADKHTGSSSVETEGFDACVVPTLVDHEKEEVIVDSKRICQYLDGELPEPTSLVPEDKTITEDVMKQVAMKIQKIRSWLRLIEIKYQRNLQEKNWHTMQMYNMRFGRKCKASLIHWTGNWKQMRIHGYVGLILPWPI